MIRKVQFIPDKDGNHVAIFDLSERKFVEKAGFRYTFRTPESVFTAMLAVGITKESVAPYLVVPEMKTLWQTLVDEIRPVLRTGEIGFCDLSGVRRTVKIGPITGYELNPKNGIDVIREILDDKNGDYYDVPESRITAGFAEGDTKARMDYASAEIRKVLVVAGVPEADIVIGAETINVKADK